MKNVNLRRAMAIVVVMCAMSCGARSQKVGGETNWLSACGTDADCGVGACNCGLCTRECSNDDSCSEIEGSLCSSGDRDAHVATCGDGREPSVCIRVDDSSGSEREPEPPLAWEDAVSREAIEGETFYGIWGTSADLWVLGRAVVPDPVPMGPSSTILLCPQDWSAESILRRRVSGGDWERVEHPATTSMRQLRGADGEIWMVGHDGAVFQHDGADWIVHDVRAAEGLEFAEASDLCAELSLHSVFARTPSDVWVVGFISPSALGPGLVLHFDGERWVRHDVGAPDGLLDVWASSDSDVWVVGNSGMAFHFDGESWSRVDSGTTQYLRSAFGHARDEVWLAGAGGTLRYFDGVALTADESFDADTSVGSLTGNAATGTFSLNTKYAEGQLSRQGVWSYEEGTWTSIAQTTDGAAVLSALFATPEGELWAVGASILRLK